MKRKQFKSSSVMVFDADLELDHAMQLRASWCR
jgi:hypothetical protein